MRRTLFLLSLIALVSCKRNEDTQAPAIQITTPVDGAQYDVGDTVRISMHVADNVELADVEIKLTDANLIPVMSTAVIQLSGDARTLQLEYFLDNYSLLSGQYYIHATVHDAARNNAKDFVLLNITEIPLQLNGIIAVTKLPGFVTVHSIDASWTAFSLGTFPGDFTDVAVNSYWQQTVMTGATTGLARCISLDGKYPGWTVNPFPSAGAYWGKVAAHERDWLINYRADGVIKSCTWNGTTGTQFLANSGYFFRNFGFSGERMFADMVDATGNSRIIGVYQRNGGGAVQQSTLGIDPIAILPRDEEAVYVAGNLSGQGKLLIYDYGMNGTWEPVTLPAGKLLSAAEIDANTLLLAMDNGNIYKFTYAPVGVLLWSAVSAQHVRYDRSEGTVITAEGASVKRYNYPGTTVIDQVSLGDSVRGVELWYNR